VKLRAARADADAAVAGAEHADAVARAALDEARRANAAHDLAAHLVAGEPCLVCQQVVTKVGRRRRPPAMEAATRAVATAERAVTRARADAATAAAAAGQADADLVQADGLLAALVDEVAAHPDPAALDAELARVRTAIAAADAARAAEADAVAAHSARADVVARLDAALDLAQAELHRQRDAVAVLGPPAPGPDLVASWSELEAWAVIEARSLAERVDADAALAAAASAAHDARLGALVERARALGCETPVRFDAVVAAVVRAEEQSVHAVRAIEAARAEAARLDAEIAAQRDDYHVAHELGRHLAAAGFPRWLVTEALELLVADASALLLRLSDGKYSLLAADGGDLDVVDHANADEVRPVRSLSGGETFQASLAFALALSDHLASLASAGAARLDAIFLDEGFGTLDADSLDTVASTIEALGGNGRMVGIVTHVRELAERVPVRYVVVKGRRSATVERVLA
jgi:exonuclease SbcC